MKNVQEPADDLNKIIEEYSNREKYQEAVEIVNGLKRKIALGDFWYNTETNELYICHGIIKGEPIWSKVDGAEKIE